MRRAKLGAVVAAFAVLALIGAGTAAAGEVRMTTCINTNGFATTTPGLLSVSIGWGTSQLGNMNKFLKEQQVVVSFQIVGDGSGVVRPVNPWSTPVLTPLPDGRKLYVSRANVALLTNAVSGTQIDVIYELSAPNGKVYDDDKLVYGPGLIFSIPCRITVT